MAFDELIIVCLKTTYHMSSPSVFSWVPVTRSVVLYVSFVDRCLYFCPFSFGHCVTCVLPEKSAMVLKVQCHLAIVW